MKLVFDFRQILNWISLLVYLWSGEFEISCFFLADLGYQEGKPRRENGSEDQDQDLEQGIQLAADDAGEKK